MSKFSPTTIIELINIHDCDETVAKMLQCPVSVVASHRSLADLVKQNTERKAAEAAKKIAERAEQSAVTRFSNEEQKIRQQTTDLLVRQLETGQHALCVDRFKAIVVKLGLTDRLPNFLLA